MLVINKNIIYVFIFITLFPNVIYCQNIEVSNLYASNKSYSSNVSINNSRFVKSFAPWLWIVRWVGGAIASWAFGKGLDYTLSRTELKNRTIQASQHLSDVKGYYNLSYSDKNLLNEVDLFYQRVASILSDYTKSEQDTRRMIQELYSNFENQINYFNSRLKNIDDKLINLEQNQSRQLRMIVDNEGNIKKLETRVEKLEDIVLPNINDYPVYKAILTLAASNVDVPNLNDESKKLGGEIFIQYNFNNYFGMYVGYIAPYIVATDVINTEFNNSPQWEYSLGALGVGMMLFPSRFPVNLLLRVGGGFSEHKLVYYEPGEEDEKNAKGDKLGELSNIFYMGQANFLITPFGWKLFCFGTFSYYGFKNEIELNNLAVPVNSGQNIKVYSFGIGYRF